MKRRAFFRALVGCLVGVAYTAASGCVPPPHDRYRPAPPHPAPRPDPRPAPRPVPHPATRPTPHRPAPKPTPHRPGPRPSNNNGNRPQPPVRKDGNRPEPVGPRR